MTAQQNRIPIIGAMAAVLALSACGAPSDTATPAAERDRMPEATASLPQSASPVPPTTIRATAAASPIRPEAPSCLAEIGAAAAARRVAICRNVSPATHPPCNAANSCAMIEDEIARACALFEGKGPPMSGCGPSPQSMAAAAAVVQRYYAAINARDFGTAWTQWGDAGRPGQTLAAFTAGFAHTRATRVTIGTLEPGDGGVGSIYQPVPVTVDATLDDGTHQRFRGTYTIRRINDVDGASASQLRWHIGSAELKRIVSR